jgi:quercetin dioxygenase-like cupin family protein
MNLKDFHTEDKPFQAKKIFSTTEGQVNSFRITAGNQLKEHTTKVPAFLVCVTGEAVFENDNGTSEKLISGDYVNIEPNVKHWVTASKDSDLLLIK